MGVQKTNEVIQGGNPLGRERSAATMPLETLPMLWKLWEGVCIPPALTPLPHLSPSRQAAFPAKAEGGMSSCLFPHSCGC